MVSANGNADAHESPAPDADQQRRYALKLAVDYGFAVFPVDHPFVGSRCAGVPTPEHDPDTCTERGKHPVGKWTQAATTDPELIAARHQFGASRARNIGIYCGACGLLVVDEDELDEFARFCADRGVKVPVTFTVRTAKGYHYYFRVPAGFDHNTGEGAFVNYEINIRAGNGYVVGPGSVHASGVTYTAVGDCRTVADAPAWLLEAVKEKQKATSSTGEATEAGWWTDGPIKASKRHQAMVAAAGWCRSRGMTRAEALPIMRDLFTRLEGNKYTLDEVLGRLDDVYTRYEAGKPLTVTTIDDPVDAEVRDLVLADVAAEAQKLRVRRAAKRMVDEEERPPAQFPEVLTLTERLARPRPAITYRIEGWQPAQTRIILAAQFKAGKTTIVGNLVRSLVDGDPWLGTAPVHRLTGRVVILDTEMGATQLDDWLADQGVRNADQVVPVPLRGKVGAVDLLNPDTRSDLARRLRDLNTEYLILDPLKPVLDALGLNEHTEAGRVLVPFDQLLDEAGVPDAAVIHHMGHVAERSRGDSRLRDWPDVEWRLVREDPDDPASPRYVSAYGRDVEVGESRLDYDPVTRRLSLVGGSRRDQGVTEALDAVLELLDAKPKLSGRQIEANLPDLARDTIRKAVKVGVGDGSLVVEDGPKRSKLHSCAPVRGSAREVRQRTESECASAPIGGRTRTHYAAPPVSEEETARTDLWVNGTGDPDSGDPTERMRAQVAAMAARASA